MAQRLVMEYGTRVQIYLVLETLSSRIRRSEYSVFDRKTVPSTQVDLKPGCTAFQCRL